MTLSANRDTSDTLFSILIGAAAKVRFPGVPEKRTLLIRSSSLGDFAVFLPFLASACKVRGEANVDLLLISRFGDVASLLLRRDRYRIAMVDPTDIRTFLASLIDARRTLRGQRYGEILYAAQNSDSAAYRFRKLAMVRLVAGMTPQARGFAPHPAIRTRGQLANTQSTLATNQAMAPFIACGMTSSATREDVWRLLDISPAEFSAAERAITQGHSPSHRDACVALYVHAKDERKRWPIDRYAQVARRLLENPDTRLCFVGGPADRAVTSEVISALSADSVKARHRIVNLAGSLSVRETIAALSHCGLFVGNDGSPAHFAALAGCSVLTLYCNWEVAGLWEPIAATQSLSLRPDSATVGDAGYGIDALTVELVLRAIDSLRATPLRHRIWTVGARDNYSERITTNSPFATDG